MCNDNLVLTPILYVVGFYLLFFFIIWLRFKLHKKHIWKLTIQTSQDFRNNTIHECCKICGKCRHRRKQ